MTISHLPTPEEAEIIPIETLAALMAASCELRDVLAALRPDFTGADFQPVMQRIAAIVEAPWRTVVEAFLDDEDVEHDRVALGMCTGCWKPVEQCAHRQGQALLLFRPVKGA